MNNLTILGIVAKDIARNCEYDTSINNFIIISTITLLISITVLILEILNKKTKFRIPIIILTAIIILLSIACIILSIELSENPY